METKRARASEPQRAWHSTGVADSLSALAVAAGTGLGGGEVAARRRQCGENRLAEAPPRAVWRSFADQFASLLILVLLGAAVLAAAVGDYVEAIVILVVVFLNAALGFWQEHRAEATLAELKQMLAPVARVRRDGELREVSAAGLVPGDIVLLAAGDRVPADGRLIETHGGVEVDESALTGESQPVAKEAESIAGEGAALGERPNMAFMNTVVTRGRAEMAVTAIGMATEMGRVSGLLADTETDPTPLQRQLDVLGRKLTLIAAIVIGIIFAFGLGRGDPLVETLITSIALAVAAIPEGLPAVVTVTLAIGMHRMARRRALVKRLAAVETLGCTTVICADKTGTLTMNRMTVRAVYAAGRRFRVSGAEHGGEGAVEAEDGSGTALPETVLRPAVLANDGRLDGARVLGDPMEGALLVLAARAGLDAEAMRRASPRLDEVPFASAHKFMATFHRQGDVVRVCVKGAPDALLGRCSRMLGPDGREEPMDESARAAWAAESERLAGEAMRVLALATREIPADRFDPAGELADQVDELTLVGLLGLIDPPRPGVRDSIALCRQAGIGVKMITGDHRSTASAIARELGLEGEVIEADELGALDEGGLASRLDGAAVFARVTPEDKVRIVRLLKARDNVVAMTGDGVNDAPALKQADIGIAMGASGTAVAREAATMVLTDDNFATIVRAVREGRAIFDNIVKFVRFQLSTNMGAIQTVLGSSLLGWPTPFTAIQILWVNIIMDGPPAMSLGVEPVRPGSMREPPRNSGRPILTWPRLARLFFYGLTMAVGTLLLYRYGQTHGELYAMTLAFTTFVLFQFFNIFNARAEHRSALNAHFFRNRYLWLSLAAVLSLQAVVVHWAPAQAVFRTTDLHAGDWLLAALVASSVLVLDEVRKLLLRRAPSLRFRQTDRAG